MFNEHTKCWRALSVVTHFNEHILHEGALSAPGGVQPTLLCGALMRTLSWNNRLKMHIKLPGMAFVGIAGLLQQDAALGITSKDITIRV